MSDPRAVPSSQARALVLAGQAPPGLRVSGHLHFTDEAGLTSLPPGLGVLSLTLRGCPNLRELPPGLDVRYLTLHGCPGLTRLPAGLRCDAIELRRVPLRSLPDDLHARLKLDVQDCAELASLPARMETVTLAVQRCPALALLPADVRVGLLDVQGCPALIGWPPQARVVVGRLWLRDCPRLAALPPGLGRLAELDVGGCSSLRELPEGLEVSGWVELARSGLTGLPASLRGVTLRWRGIPIDERAAFRPETLTAAEVLGERNAERRRVLIERVGYERLLGQAGAEVLDADRDPGGERRLLRIPLAGDEPVVCVAVRCPSTGRQYVIRVPPAMTTCRQAVAWVAGFDDPDQYRPLVET